MKRLTEKDNNGHYKLETKNLEYYCICRDEKGTNTVRGQHINKLAHYEDLEDRLNGISVEQVVNTFIRTAENQTHEGYERGRILTNEDADEWEEYKRLKEQGLLIKLKK